MNRLTQATAPILAASLLLCLVPSTAKASPAPKPTLSFGARTVGSVPVRLIAPVEKPELVRSFLQPTSDYSSGHRGVDYRVSLGQNVFSPTEGIVWFAGKVVNRMLVTIRDTSGNLVEVEPVCPTVKSNLAVHIGVGIGKVCDADQNYQQHCSQLRCLHFSYRTPNGYLSPIWVMGQLAPSVLAPWSDV